MSRVPMLSALCLLSGSLWPSTALVISSSQTVTPVEKVITLLEQLSEQVTEEGNREAVQYNKFAGFCKTQTGFKQSAIAKSSEKIASLTATIDALNSEINELNSEITALGLRIDEITGLEEVEMNSSKAAHAVYVVEAENLTTAIRATTQAIEALSASKSGLQGNAKLDLAQLSATVSQAVQLAPAQLLLVSKLSTDAKGKQAPPSYTYHSNEILTTLQDLMATFKSAKAELDQTEFDRQAASDKTLLGLANEKKFKSQAKADKEQLVGEKSEALNKAEGDRTAETNDSNADTAFLTELTSQCAARKTEFEQRSQARADELKAIADATRALKTGVVPNYAANKKLVSFERNASIQRVGKSDAKPTPATVKKHVSINSTGKPVNRSSGPASSSEHAPPALLQVAAEGADKTAKAITMRAVSHLDEEAQRLHSPVLAAVAAKVSVQEDHFVKVRGLIKDLVAKLEADATAEATTKSYCDTQMSATLATRDARQLDIETQTATIAQQEASKAQLEREIATLEQDIADLEKTKNETELLRAEESAANSQTLSDAGAGKTAVESAISTLQAYYSSLQVSGGQPAPAPYTPYVAPGSDREGLTVGDRAPEMSYSGDYTGKADAATGIIGILQVILSDFDRTLTEVAAAEAAAVAAHTQFLTDTQNSINTKTSEKTTKEAAVVTAEDAITTATTALEDAEGLHATALTELENLKAMCVEGEESWEERKEQREKEIAALKEALKILEEWQT